MQVTTRRRLQKLAASVLLLVLVLFASGWVIFVRDSRSVDVREFSAIRDDWERAVLGHVKAGRLLPGMSPPKPVPPLEGQEKLAADQRLTKRCLEVAKKHPNTVGELGALFLAAVRGAEAGSGQEAQAMLVARVETADLAQLLRGIRESRLSGSDVQPAIHAIAPSIIRRVEKSPDPSAAALLTYICSSTSFDSRTKEPPPLFAEVADLIADNYASSPDIFNFCESLGGLHFSPHWASEFEPHLRRILEQNKHQSVRCTASIALASVVQLSVDRQAEAEKLYERFLAEFDGQHEYSFQRVEQVLRERAEQRLLGMQFAPIGRLAPEVEGVDLDGRPMKLSEYRGKVVLMSFWATWCGPCMKFIQHERELAARLVDEPFAIVGVNGDEKEQNFARAVREYEINWRSFRDKRPGRESISDEWTAFYPTVFLIDHRGIIRKRWTGLPPHEVVDQMVDELVQVARSE